MKHLSKVLITSSAIVLGLASFSAMAKHPTPPPVPACPSVNEDQMTNFLQSTGSQFRHNTVNTYGAPVTGYIYTGSIPSNWNASKYSMIVINGGDNVKNVLSGSQSDVENVMSAGGKAVGHSMHHKGFHPKDKNLYYATCTFSGDSGGTGAVNIIFYTPVVDPKHK